MCPGGSILHDPDGGSRDRSLRYRRNQRCWKVQPQQPQNSLRLVRSNLGLSSCEDERFRQG